MIIYQKNKRNDKKLSKKYKLHPKIVQSNIVKLMSKANKKKQSY